MKLLGEYWGRIKVYENKRGTLVPKIGSKILIEKSIKEVNSKWQR